MLQNKAAAGHLAAMFTVLIWGTTFVSTKVLLTFLSPLETLFFRFLIGYIALLILCPRFMKIPPRHEVLFLAAGLCGVTLYFLLETIALTLTLASNVGVITTLAPFFTAVLSYAYLKSERPKPQFFVGFLCAITGIVLISLNGQAMQLNPLGDLLTVFAAFTWAVYSILLRRIGMLGYGNLLCTRRIFFYGLLTMLPAFLFLDFSPDFSALKDPVCLFNLVYLGLGASAVCYLAWNFATRELGAVKTSAYIYGQPVVTVIMSAIVLGERIMPLAALGTVLTLCGLVISEYRRRKPPEAAPVPEPEPLPEPVQEPLPEPVPVPDEQPEPPDEQS